MGLRVQFKRGASKYIMNHTFDDGEIVINTDTKSLHVGDGETLGGHEIPSKVEVENIVKDAVSISKDPEDLENGSFTVSQSSNVITEDPDVSILALQNDIWGYKNTVDYAVGTYVMYQNNIYKCIQANGTSSTVVAPDSVSPLGSDYWKNIENQSSGHALFDIVPKDHVLTYGKDLEGFALLGTWVYKDAVDGSRYGYPDFVQKCLDEYGEATADTITVDSDTLNIKRHSNGHIYFDIADIETVNTYFNTYGHAWFYGIDETNERIFLPRQAHGKLIESYKNGTDWYRIYEDGWCEQGSEVSVTSNSNTTISLFKQYVDTNYSNIITRLCTTTDSNTTYSIVPTSKTVSSFIVHIFGTNGNDKVAWVTSGYINLENIEVTPSYDYMVVGNVKVEQASTEVIDATTTNNDTVPLFTAHYFDYTPNNLSWLKGGEQSNSGDLYKTCYNELVNVLNGETKYGSLKVIDVADMASGEGYSLYWIVDQVNKTFRTPTATQQRFVVKTYQDGTDWYRIYNDGWCEQGGLITQNSNTGRTVNLLKNYRDTNYIALVNPGNIAYSEYGYGYIGTRNISSFDCVIVDNVSVKATWLACGYIDLTNETFDKSLYFKVANAVENIQLLDVGEVTQALSGKVDNTNTEWAINACMPDYSAGISLTSGILYTADKDGWLEICANEYGTGGTTLTINGITKTLVTNITDHITDSWLMLPISKGTTYQVNFGRTTYSYYNFFPCKGVN